MTWEEKHSVNCIICGELVDERDCTPQEQGGDICPECEPRFLFLEQLDIMIKRYEREDKEDPYADREYPREVLRVLRLLKKNGADRIQSASDRAVYDIVHELLELRKDANK